MTVSTDHSQESQKQVQVEGFLHFHRKQLHSLITRIFVVKWKTEVHDNSHPDQYLSNDREYPQRIKLPRPPATQMNYLTEKVCKITVWEPRFHLMSHSLSFV